MSCAAFARRALRGAARADADDADVCRGWPVTDDDFVLKKIVYPRCRSFARAPSDLDPALIDRSMFKPDADLRLDFVYGYDGVDCTAPNVRVTADPNTVVYCAAAVAVVHDAARDAQAHFRGHTRDITCLTLCDAEVTVGGVTYPPKTLCATGQRVPSADAASYVDDDDEHVDTMASAEASAKSGAADAADAADAAARPFVAVWDVRTPAGAHVPLAADARAVAGVAFSRTARARHRGLRYNHTVQVWDWRVARVGEPRRSRTRTRRSKTTTRSNERDRTNDRSNDRSNERSEPFGEILPSSASGVSTPALVGLLHENTGFKERPGGVFGLEFDPFAKRAGDDAVAARFVSYGKKHVKAWTHLARTNEWVSRPMSFGSHGVRDVCSVAFLPPPKRKKGKESGGTLAALVTGHPDGSLLVWRGGAAVQKIEGAHGRGARAIQPDGSVAWGGGVRAMRLRLGFEPGDHGATLVTGGADGALAQWAVVDGTLAGKITEPLVLAESRRPGVAFSNAVLSDAGVRAIDVVPGTDRVVAGTSRCELWDVDLHPERETASVLTRGHKASLLAACWHPSDPDRFYTACASGAVHAWDAARTAMTRRCALAFAATSIAVGGDAARDTQTHVAVGGEDGEVLVLTESSFEVVFAAKDARGAGAEDLKFSPDGGSRLAVTYRDGKVEVFRRNAADSKGPRYEKMARFKGHSASARHVDWSADGATLATCGADYEILHWDVPLAWQKKCVEGASALRDPRRAEPVLPARPPLRDAHRGSRFPGDGRVAVSVRRHGRQRAGRLAVRALRGHRGRRRVREALRVPGFGGERAAPRVPRARRARHYGPVQLRRHARGLRRGARPRGVPVLPAPPPGARARAAAARAPLDASGKVGFREPREGGGGGRRTGAIPARKETLGELDSDEILEDRGRTSRCSSEAGGRPQDPNRRAARSSSLLEVDANA